MPSDAEQVRAALRSSLPAEDVVVDPDVLESYRADRAPFVEAGTPAAVVRPRRTEEVVATVKAAASVGAPIVPRGAGSGLSGGANAIDGCIVLSLERMNRIVAVEPANHLIVVEPGVITADVDAAAQAAGMRYPPDPASREFCSIGGNIATNAGGLCCVKYGVTSDHVLALEVVLADGSVLRTGHRSRKGVAGYDLAHLFVGSEGTLGIVTQATLRIRPAAPAPATLVATFNTLGDAGAAATAILSSVVPTMLELIDNTTMRAVEAFQPMGLDTSAAVMMLARSDAPNADDELLAVEAACAGAGADMVVRSSDPAEAELLMSARKLANPALAQTGMTLMDDVAVPPGAIPDLLAGIADIDRRIGERGPVHVATFGHVGDGNMHPTIVYEDGSGALAYEAFEQILALALSLGGTVTGEHGVGLLKREALATEIGEAGLAVHRAIKAALDPAGILNPGKAF